MKRGVGLPGDGRLRTLAGVLAILLIALVMPVVGLGAAGAQTAVAGDFDGDGYADLVVGVAGKDIGRHPDAGILTVVYGGRSGVDPSRSLAVAQGRSAEGVAGAGNQFGRSFASGDINGDGFADLIAGAPNDTEASIVSAGSVTTVYGSRRGLSGTGSERITQPAGSADGPETGDRLGSAVASGDIDGDGFDDLVIGVPGEAVGSSVDAGVVHVLLGGRAGIDEDTPTTFAQGDGLPDMAEAGDGFGGSLVVGDFDGDGFADVAIGAAGETVDGATGAGSVSVLYGSAVGLDRSRAQHWSQADAVADAPEANDQFGRALAAGDFDGDGVDDLAIGVPGETIGSAGDAGAVNILVGGREGLVSGAASLITQGGAVPDRSDPNDRFGASLATGDFDGDRDDDLAIGAPGEGIGRTAGAGSVTVVRGSGSGLRTSGARVLSQAGRIRNEPDAQDGFAASLLSVDLDGDRRSDLVIGVPGEDLRAGYDAGISHVLYGSQRGLTTVGNTVVSQAGRVVGNPHRGDSLGGLDGDSWLDRVNLYRRQAGLDPVTERADLSATAEHHSRYMVLNGEVTHHETPRRPGYSDEGDASGGRSNVYGTTLGSTSDVAAVDGWVTGPFHAVGFLTPTLSEVGFGSHRDRDASFIEMAATLDIYGAERDWSARVDGAYAWPGDGSVVPVRNHISEWPSPTTACPSHQGLPVLAFFEATPSVSQVRFEGPEGAVDVCVFDGLDYRNPDAAARDLGRAILANANAVVVMTREPLVPGERYCFSVRSRSELVESCFGVDPNA